ncbi:MAG: LPS assembly protein LptD, partial [bacterium]|nr:LPS assembly protein LptD [bacterium]
MFNGFIKAHPFKAHFYLLNRTGLLGFIPFGLCTALFVYEHRVYASELINEPIHACVIARDVDLTNAIRSQFAQCLGWQSDETSPVCHGTYQPISVMPLADVEQVHIMADHVSFYQKKRSSLLGHVEVQQTQRIVNAQTAYLYRDAKTNQVNKIEFLGEVHYLEPGKLMIARKATINPQDKSGEVNDVLYRFNSERGKATLPAWGRARFIRRFANKDYLLHQATYSTCAPNDKAWHIEAQSINLDNAKATGVAKNATIRIREWPVFYTPYLSFPTNNERKSGLLMPLIGYSNVGGFDFGLPYYLNLAPNYDMTLTPHSFSERGVMLGGEFRYLTAKSYGMLKGSFLPNDRAYKNFILNNEYKFPYLRNSSTNRWSFAILETTKLAPNLRFHVSAEQVSDDYYLQDFSSNLAQITERQLLREADLIYTTSHWIYKGLVQSYQTLHPVNEPPVASVYEQLPQLSARGHYSELPFNANFNVLGQYDQFHWPTHFRNDINVPQGPRFYLNPVLSVPVVKPWGYMTPTIQMVTNYYEVQNSWGVPNTTFERTIPRYSVDSALFF